MTYNVFSGTLNPTHFTSLGQYSRKSNDKLVLLLVTVCRRTGCSSSVSRHITRWVQCWQVSTRRRLWWEGRRYDSVRLSIRLFGVARSRCMCYRRTTIRVSVSSPATSVSSPAAHPTVTRRPLLMTLLQIQPPRRVRSIVISVSVCLSARDVYNKQGAKNNVLPVFMQSRKPAMSCASYSTTWRNVYKSTTVMLVILPYRRRIW